MDKSDEWVLIKEEEIPNNHDFEIIGYEQLPGRMITNDLFEVSLTPEETGDHGFEETQLSVAQESSSCNLISEEVNSLMSSLSSPPNSFEQEEDRMPSYESGYGETAILNLYPKDSYVGSSEVSQIAHQYSERNRNESRNDNNIRTILDTIGNTENENHLSSAPSTSDFRCVGEETVSVNGESVGTQICGRKREGSLQENIYSRKRKKNTSLKR